MELYSRALVAKETTKIYNMKKEIQIFSISKLLGGDYHICIQIGRHFFKQTERISKEGIMKTFDIDEKEFKRILKLK